MKAELLFFHLPFATHHSALMKELWLKYTDQNGEIRRVSAACELFTVGRHPENDLCISDHRLSREHIRIEQYNDNFYVSDSGSSNGTTFNGAPLNEAVVLRNGDLLNLGGAIAVQIEVSSSANNLTQAAAAESVRLTNEQTAASPANSPAAQVPIGDQSSATAASDSGSFPTALFWLAPIFGLIILVFAGGLFLALSGNKERQATRNEDVYTAPTRNRTTKTDDSPTDESAKPKKSDSPGGANGAVSSTPDSNNFSPTPKVSADSEKVEQHAAAFLRRIAQNDPTAFLTGKQAEIVNSKIAAFKGSSQLAENLKAVKKDQAQFETLANSKNLKAQFLAAAALARIGNQRGDPLAVAQTILPILNDLKITLDNKLAGDNLLIIAAFERGAAGKPRSLQSTLEALSKTTQNVSPREIRSIWFLHEKGKITDAEFNFAVQFLAIGAITQNPKDFNVNAEAVTFN